MEIDLDPHLNPDSNPDPYPTLTLIALWGIGNAMIIFIAGINSVPADLYDAAQVDGASSWQQFRTITVPMISPVLFYNVVVALIGLFQYFLVPFVLKNGSGDPGGATFFYSMYFYRTLFRLQNMGYAATLASFGPFSALYFLFYERLKSAHASHLRSSATRTSDAMVAASGGAEEVPVAYALLHGAAAGNAARIASVSVVPCFRQAS